MKKSRYALDEFFRICDGINVLSTLDQEVLGALLDRVSGADLGIGGVSVLPSRTIPLHVQLASSVSGDVGRTLLDLDVELRRALSQVTNGSLQPFRDRGTVEFFWGRRIASTDCFVLLSCPFHEVLLTTPLDFLLTLSWFWNLRLNQTKTSTAKNIENQIASLNAIASSATESVRLGQPTVITLRVDAIESTASTHGFSRTQTSPKNAKPTLDSAK